MTTTARETHLVRRPHGEPVPEDFALVDRELPDPADGEVLVAVRHFSVDPYMRGRMNDVPSYVAPFALDEAMDGRAVGEVVESRAEGFAPGDVVVGNLAWRSHGVAAASTLLTVPGGLDPKAYLGVLGVPGLTAWIGLFDKADFREGDRVFVSGAAGAVGSLVVQLAKLRGAAQVIGSVGSAQKAAWVRDELGADVALNYRDAPIREQLRDAAPEGIDVYFDNVGADHLEAAIDSANDHARFAACGAIAHYNDTADDPTPGPRNLFQIVKKRLTIRGFIVTDDIRRYREFLDDVTPLVADGRVRFQETVVEGVDHSVDAFLGMMRGENTGKMIVSV